MHSSVKAAVVSPIILVLLLVTLALYWRIQNVDPSEPDVAMKSYAKAHTLVVSSQASSLRYRAKAHTAVTASVR